MKLEQYLYDDVVILKCTGELDSFNLSGFSNGIDKITSEGHNFLVLDLHLLKFINSAALGYLINTSKTIARRGGAMVLTRPSRFVTKTLGTLGLEQLFTVSETVEDAITRFEKNITGEELENLQRFLDDDDTANAE